MSRVISPLIWVMNMVTLLTYNSTSQWAYGF